MVKPIALKNLTNNLQIKTFEKDNIWNILNEIMFKFALNLLIKFLAQLKTRHYHSIAMDFRQVTVYS